MIGWAAALLPTAWRELLPYRLPFAYLQMPLLYAYAVSLCFPARRSVRHLIGGIVAALACAITLVPLPEGVASSLLPGRSEEHTSELQSLMRISYAVLCMKKKKHNYRTQTTDTNRNRTEDKQYYQ